MKKFIRSTLCVVACYTALLSNLTYAEENFSQNTQSSHENVCPDLLTLTPRMVFSDGWFNLNVYNGGHLYVDREANRYFIPLEGQLFSNHGKVHVFFWSHFDLEKPYIEKRFFHRNVYRSSVEAGTSFNRLLCTYKMSKEHYNSHDELIPKKTKTFTLVLHEITEEMQEESN